MSIMHGIVVRSSTLYQRDDNDGDTQTEEERTVVYFSTYIQRRKAKDFTTFECRGGHP